MAMEKYTHEFSDGSKLSVQRFKNLPFGVVRKVKDASEEDAVFLIIEKLFSENSREMKIIDKQSMEQVAEFFEAWANDSGAGSGK